MYDYKCAHMLQKFQSLVTFPINYSSKEGGETVEKTAAHTEKSSGERCFDGGLDAPPAGGGYHAGA